jgi:SET domain-containing protein
MAVARGARKEPLLVVRDSGIHGRGVFAARPIRRGRRVVEYTGERISHQKADRRYDDERMDWHHTFLFTVDRRTVVDASRGGNEARFINHSCEPNCEAWNIGGRIWIVALREIAPGEELTYDYNYEREEGEDDAAAARRYPCRCGAPNCRGTIVRPREMRRGAPRGLRSRC